VQAAGNTAESQTPKAEGKYRIQLKAKGLKLKANTEYSFAPGVFAAT
jgi:hypothetical protein